MASPGTRRCSSRTGFVGSAAIMASLLWWSKGLLRGESQSNTNKKSYKECECLYRAVRWPGIAFPKAHRFPIYPTRPTGTAKCSFGPIHSTQRDGPESELKSHDCHMTGFQLSVS